MRTSLTLLLASVALLMLPGCAVAGGIFKAGMWFGILGVVIILVIIFAVIGKSRK